MEKIKQLDWIEIIGYAAIVFLIFIMGLVYFIDRAEANYLPNSYSNATAGEEMYAVACGNYKYFTIPTGFYGTSTYPTLYLTNAKPAYLYLYQISSTGTVEQVRADLSVPTSSTPFYYQMEFDNTYVTSTITFDASKKYVFAADTLDCSSPLILYGVNGSFGFYSSSYGHSATSSRDFTAYMNWGSSTYESVFLEMKYPTSEITNPIKYLNNWVIHATGLQSRTGELGVSYGQTSSSLSYSYADCILNEGYSTCDVTGEEDIYAMVNRTNLYEVSNSTTTWFAKPYFFDSDSLSFTYGELIQFSIDPLNGINPPSNEINTSILALGLGNNDVINTPGYYQPTSSKDIWCIAPSATSSFLDGWWLSYSLCRVSEILLKPHDISSNYVISNFNTMRELFPLSIVNNIITPLTALGESTSTGNTSYTLSIPDIGNINIISSSSFTNAVGSTTQTNILNFQKMIIWVLAGISALLIIF